MTFSELAKWYLNLESVKAKAYYKTLEINLASFNKVFGDTKVKDIKKSDLENYQTIRKKQGFSDSYVDHFRHGCVVKTPFGNKFQRRLHNVGAFVRIYQFYKLLTQVNEYSFFVKF